jgi:hypothetical protein
LQVQSPEFKPQSHQKKKKTGSDVSEVTQDNKVKSHRTWKEVLGKGQGRKISRSPGLYSKTLYFKKKKKRKS